MNANERDALMKPPVPGRMPKWRHHVRTLVCDSLCAACDITRTTGAAQALRPNPEGASRLFRIGDAVAARNTHAAIHDALRVVKDL